MSGDRIAENGTDQQVPHLDVESEAGAGANILADPQPLFPKFTRPLILMVLTVLLVESFIETLLGRLIDAGLVVHIFLDAFLTILLLSPLFYLFLYRPFKRLDRERLESKNEVQALTRQLMRTVEKERHSLARDLHDDFGQILTALQLGVETIKVSSEQGLSPSADQTATLEACWGQGEKLSHLIAVLGDRVRSISSGLRPAMLEELGLPETLEWLIGEYKQGSSDIRFSFNCEAHTERYHPDVELAMFRICQEALNNVVKHAKASQVEVGLSHVDSVLTLTVKDDGNGFGGEELRSARAGRRGTGKRGVGLLGMQERAASQNGEVEISSGRGKGTEICVKIPTRWRKRKENR